MLQTLVTDSTTKVSDNGSKSRMLQKLMSNVACYMLIVFGSIVVAVHAIQWEM